ncbi:hypothetical protein ABZS76_33490 [Streptomyces sp. NPDC005562]|uniref:hypothetical protein n=1 Tax=Streptomyces sp. NPDC005562 TaxID=3154890 RepID=UPI0033B29155
MTTTATVKIPPHIRTAMVDADQAEWEVHRRPRTVLFIPPQGKNVSVPLTRSEEEVREMLTEAGLYAAEQAPAQEPSAEQAPAAEAPSQPKRLICPECHEDRFTRPAALGAHRSKAHGVAGAWRSSRKPEKAAQALELSAEVASAVQALVAEISSAAAGEVSALRSDIAAKDREIARLKHQLADRVTKARAEKISEDLKEAKAQIKDLRRFKDKVEAEVCNQDQAPVQAIVNIIRAGGRGFGLHKK